MRKKKHSKTTASKLNLKKKIVAREIKSSFKSNFLSFKNKFQIAWQENYYSKLIHRIHIGLLPKLFLSVHFLELLEKPFGRFPRPGQFWLINSATFCESAEDDLRLLFTSRAIGVKSGAKSAARLPCVWCHAIRHVCFVNEMLKILNMEEEKSAQHLCCAKRRGVQV